MRAPCVTSVGRVLGLGPLKALIRRLELLVTTDTGPRAIARAFGVPTVVLMGPTDPRWTAGDEATDVVIRHDVPCGPCHLPRCPTDHRCMTMISTDEVVAAVLARLS